ncbi:AAA family ATPase [Streptomyces sp. S.PNR 29]|uniref:AAA family ATPase n=1 Tax=Streptomyces sp. S.PNR 29 TaxID=2973805 RepID=UPI0025B26553|nr:AAA family ATPase [Streptomyces sp. S.PNR 29]MDN0195945.1 TniB family NTP-binding protein [Streptomyces sp. S.PNR 29]
MTSPLTSVLFEGDDRQYSPTRLDGWLEFVDGPDRISPPLLTREQMAELSRQELLRYNDSRHVWHANIGPIKTPQLLQLHEDLYEIVGSNRHDGDKAKPAALVDAYPGIGKSTAVREFGRDFHREQIALRGETTTEGHRRVPVIYIALTGNTQIRGLNAAICRFYRLPTAGDADTLAERAVDAVLSLKTSIFIIDDIHFLASANSNSARLVNQLKFLSNTFPVTLIYVGVGVRERGILSEGRSLTEALHAQFGRRTTALTLRPFQVGDESGRIEFRKVLLTIEKKLVLADKYPGMLADDLADYLLAHSSGHFASLMALINRGCYRAIHSGHERLDAELMNRVKNDAAAEAARLELVAALEAGLLTAKPHRRSSRKTA